MLGLAFGRSACCQKKARVTEIASEGGGNPPLLRIVLVYQINVCSYVDADKCVQDKSPGQMDVVSWSVSKWHENRRLFNYMSPTSVER